MRLWFGRNALWKLRNERGGKTGGARSRQPRKPRRLAAAQPFQEAQAVASVLPIYQGACGAPRSLSSCPGRMARSRRVWQEVSWGYHHLNYRFSCSCKRKCPHVILVHTDLKDDAGLKSVRIWNESVCGGKPMTHSTQGWLGSTSYSSCSSASRIYLKLLIFRKFPFG